MKYSICAAWCIALAALLCTCETRRMAGGSSDTGNAAVAAVIYTSGGARAAGASVTLCPRNYTEGINADSLGASASVKRTLTDNSGCFRIDSIDDGDYCIEVNDRISRAVLLKASIAAPAGRTITLTDTLRPYAGIAGSAGPSPSPSLQRYLLAYGLERRAAIGADGDFRLMNLPQGVLRFRIVAADSAFIPVDIDSITVTSGQTDSIPGMGWRYRARIVLNTAATGAGVEKDVFDFPVLIRLTNANFNFNEAKNGGADCRFAKQDNTDLAFEVERWDSTGKAAEIWVRVDTVRGNGNSQYFNFYWGNPNATHAPAIGMVFDTAHGFQGVWHLSDSSIDFVNDATLNLFQGRAEGMTNGNIVDGMIGKARSFDGVSSAISIINSEDGKLNFPQDGYYSLSAWVYTESADNATHAIVSKGDEQYFLCSIAQQSNSSTWDFTEFQDAVGWQTCQWPVSTMQWTYIVGVRQGAAQYFYVNGNLVDTTIDLLAATKARNSTLGVAIGKFAGDNGSLGDSYFIGVIDEARMQSNSLSADWIRLCYMNQRSDDKLVSIK